MTHSSTKLEDVSPPSPELLAAELYVLLHRGNPGDVGFYKKACKGGDRVLELGSGAGRIAIPLARAGHQITGLELSPSMRTLAERAAQAETEKTRAQLTWIAGDMRNFSLPVQFDRVILPNNVLCCLLAPAALRECLSCAVQHLAPGGRLILDVYNCDDDLLEENDPADEEGEAEPLVALNHRGLLYDVYEESHWHNDAQRLEVTYRHVPRNGGETVTYEIPQRYLRDAELDRLLDSVGLRTLESWGGFRGERPGAGQAHCVRVATHENKRG